MNRVSWQPGMKLWQVEMEVIRAAMEHYKKNKTVVAQTLDISIRTLDAKLEKIRKEDEEHEERLLKSKQEREEFLLRQRGLPAGSSHALYGTILVK